MTFRVMQPFPGRLTVLATLLAGMSASALAAPGPVVISQVYGGGGNTGAPFTNDFIELFNRSANPVSLKGWSVQYASAAGTFNGITALGDVTLQPGQYYLVQEGAGNGAGVALPTPDSSASLALSATVGKIILASSTTTATPTGATTVDLVGFGTTANAFEGSGPTPAPSNSLAVLRANGGCTDTDVNSADFSTGAPTPRNTASAFNVCAGGGTPAAQPIVPSCPASIAGAAGSAFSGALSAKDLDSIVNNAVITSGAVQGISLVGFQAAGGIGGTATVTLSVDAGIAAGTYPVSVGFTNNDGQDASCSFNVAVSGKLRIPQIQGSGAASPFANTVQSTTGVITKKFSGTGFFIQDPDGDNDPTTSDAIYVFDTTTANVGDLVSVTGTVTEYTPSGASRSYTEFTKVTVTPISSGHTITPTNIELPTADLARYEAMLVRFTTPLTVNGNNYLGDRGELVLSNGRRETATNRYRAGTPQAVALAQANEQNYVLLDDGIFVTPDHIPYLGENGTVRSGDTVTDLVGVLDFGSIGGGSGWYKLQPTDAPVFSRSNARQAAPVVASGNVKVASANVLNFFTTFTDGTDATGATGQGCKVGSTTSKSNCRGADNMAEFVRQRDKIVNELKAMNADAVGLMEIQNNDDGAVAYLVNALNQSIGATTYA
jgi:predicted extracellular nuclease